MSRKHDERPDFEMMQIKPSQSLKLQGFSIGADDENRTHNLSLGSSRFATKLHPQRLIYHL